MLIITIDKAHIMINQGLRKTRIIKRNRLLITIDDTNTDKIPF